MRVLLMVNSLILLCLILIQPSKQQGGLFSSEDNPLFEKTKIGYLVVLERYTWLFIVIELLLVLKEMVI